MYTYTIEAKAGCNACRRWSSLAFGLTSQSELSAPSSTFLLQQISNCKMTTCPTCGVVGDFEVMELKFRGYVYNMENPTKPGRIMLEAYKKNGNISDQALSSNHNEFSLLDYKNALLCIRRHINWMREEYELMPRSGVSMLSAPGGGLQLEANFFASGSYVQGDGTVYGFSYKEIDEVVRMAEQKVGISPWAV